MSDELTMEKLFEGIPSEGDEINVAEETPETPTEEAQAEEQETAKSDEIVGKKEEEAVETPVESEEEKENHAARRWRTMMVRQKEKDKEIDELKSTLKGFEERLSQIKTPTQAAELPEEFVELFGQVPEAWTPFQKLIARETQKLADDAVERRISDLRSQKGNDEKELEKANEYIENELADLSEEMGVDLTNPRSNIRNGILKIATDPTIAPLDKDGNISLKKAAAIYKAMNPAKPVSEERKKAAQIASEPSEGASTTQATTPGLGNFKNKSWQSFLPKS